MRKARETLDQMILLGESHMLKTLRAIELHHNRRRPHQGLNNRIPEPFDYPDAPAPPKVVRCDAELGGLLNHYHDQRLKQAT